MDIYKQERLAYYKSIGIPPPPEAPLPPLPLSPEKLKELKTIHKKVCKFVKKLNLKTGIKQKRDARIIYEMHSLASWIGDDFDFDFSGYFNLVYQSTWINPDTYFPYEPYDEGIGFGRYADQLKETYEGYLEILNTEPHLVYWLS